MSASNWRECPKCIKKDEDERILKIQKLEDSYGKIPADQYINMRIEAETPTTLTKTLREDFLQGMSLDSEYYVEYSCSCEICGFAFNYQYSKKVKL